MRRFLVSLFFILSLFGCSQQTRALKPFRPISPTAQPIYSNIEDQAIDATHAQLFVNADAFLDQLIRIEGNFAPIEVSGCANHKGPLLQWGLVGLNAQGSSLLMNASGFERAVALVPDGAPFIVDGIWQRYTGSLGCGKEPPPQTIYFLEVIEILQPNPIVRGGAIAIDDNAVFPRVPGNDGEQEGLVEPLNEDAAPGSTPEATDVQDEGAVENAVVVEITATEAAVEPTRIAPPTPTPSPTRTPRPNTTTDNSVAPPTLAPTETRTPFPTSVATEEPTRTPFPTSAANDEPTATPMPSGDDDATTTRPTATPREEGTVEATETPDPDATTTPTPDPDDEPLSTATPTPTVEGEPAETPEPTATPDAGIGTTEPDEPATPLPPANPYPSYP